MVTCASSILRSDDLSNCASAVLCTLPLLLSRCPLSLSCSPLSSYRLLIALLCPANKAFVLQLHPDKQRAIAEELDRNPGEVLKKIEDIRNKIL